MIRFQRKFPWLTRRAAKPAVEQGKRREPLREFVYLDEVSLSSLLASQKGEITENTTVQTSNELVVETSSGMSVGVSGLPTAEINSRFQTTNSNALQSVRKATAQSRFRELHNLEHLRKIRPVNVSIKAQTEGDIFSSIFHGAVHSASQLQRGDLVEFKVNLSASWIFQISTIIAEFSDMFDESPSLFIENVKFSDLYNAKNANKVINRLLAGLIPVDGVVSDYVVISRNDEKFVIQKEVISGLDVKSYPLRIVGVTEHLAYWKDIRRILFANNEFTILCRLAKSGIQRSWNPIKVADIFKEFAPDIAMQIESASRTAMTQSPQVENEERILPAPSQMTIALTRYADSLLDHEDMQISSEQHAVLDSQIADISVNDVTAEGQREAFLKVKQLVENVTAKTVDPVFDLEARENVRRNFGIPLLPIAAQPSPSNDITETGSAEPDEANENLLDVEVVAIYW